MAFTNRIRLPFELKKPQYPVEKDAYRRGDGITKTLSVVIRKVFEGQTDEMPSKLHERLIIALSHDNVSIEGDNYLGVISLDGDYNIEWSDFLNRPIAQAKFKAEVTPFNATNSNCGTCEEYTQIVCVDDDIGTIEEGEEVNVDVLDNDEICCNPVQISIITFDTTFVDSITIESDNTLNIILKTPLANANSVILATYRAQCENGQYDDANIIANIDGTDPEPVCLAPTNVQLDEVISDTSASFTWDAPSPVPDCGYHWQVRQFAMDTVVAEGDTTDLFVTVTGLSGGSAIERRFYVRSNCCDDFNSNYAGPVVFNLLSPSEEDTCGQYSVSNHNFSDFMNLSYIDCNGDPQNIFIGPAVTEIICALQTSPGNPVEITPSSPDSTITYLGLC